MEYRREHRVSIAQRVSLTVLGAGEKRFAVTIKNTTIRGLGLLCPEPVACGALVQIEEVDSIFLGEVMYCQPAEGGSFLGIKLTEVLRRLTALRHMALEFAAELALEVSLGSGIRAP